MAYLTCPWCLMAQQVDEAAPTFHCYSCGSDLRFAECSSCGFKQSVRRDWSAFTCGRCGSKTELPRATGYEPGALKAYQVQGVGRSWPAV
jgi:predicted RNA-binding Zn-ribbon protein involved in translation (DUF1610 family)